MSEPYKATYVILDAARMDEKIESAFQKNRDHLCLFSGKGEEYLKSVSPYLFSFTDKSEISNFLIEEGIGNSWGVFFHSRNSFSEIFKHLQNLLVVKTADGKEMYFRFYDPRVLRVFLPVAYKEQLKEFFGPIEYFICEDEDPEFMLIFSLVNGSLEIKKEITKKYFNLQHTPTPTPSPDPTETKENKTTRKWSFLVDDDGE